MAAAGLRRSIIETNSDTKEAPMPVESCIPVIPSADLEKSMRFWVDGLGFARSLEMRKNDKLVGCMLRNKNLAFWLNQRAGTPIKPEDYNGISLYWAPSDIVRPGNT
jgi:hypothetical protein